MMKKYIYKLFLLVIFLSGSLAHSQSIKGTVSDIDGPMPQVNIAVKGTNNFTTTDFDGHYTISNVDANAILVFSYIGYQTQETALSGRKDVNVILVSDVNTLNEVVIVGYTSEKKICNYRCSSNGKYG